MAVTIHFIRHGHVDDPGDVYYGRLPGYPLSQQGRSEVKRLAEHLTTFPISEVYSSPLLRTMQTAEIIAHQLGSQVVADERIVEVKAKFEGKTRTFLREHQPTAEDYAETMEQIFERMQDFVQDCSKLHPTTEIVAVSHGGPIRILEMGIEGLPFTDYAYEEDGAPDCASDTLVIVDAGKLTAKRLRF